MRAKLIQANSLHIPLADKSVQTCVTSPPYYGLRDYGTAEWVGGDPECDHNPQRPDGGQRADRSLPLGRGGMYKETCGKCGAVRADAQLGLEPTLAEYIENMCQVFDEVWRVLRDDGTLWLNMGDSYNGSGGAGGDYNAGGLKDGQPRYPGRNENAFKPKDLMGVPWTLAKALQAPRYMGRIKSETDRAWMAAIIDGEGTITGTEYQRKRDGYTRTDYFVFVTNADTRMLDRCGEIWPGTVYSHMKNSESHLGNRDTFRWKVSGIAEKQLLLAELYPYLITKKKQALLAWNMGNFIADAKHTGCRGQASDVYEKRKTIVNLIKSLNAGNDEDIPSWCNEPYGLYRQGWYLRSDIIWHKPNPMPESVTDRPTKAHEYIFLLTKNKTYYYDADAIREPLTESSKERGKYGWTGNTGNALEMGATPGGGGFNRLKKTGETMDALYNPAGRNKRTVWTVTTKPYSGAHFATFPPDLIEPCILAGTSEKGQCPECGSPWERVVERETIGGEKKIGIKTTGVGQGGTLGSTAPHGQRTPRITTTGWRPTCEHEHDPVPQIVLDPFGGSGTTAQVAQAHGRIGVCLDLSWDYLQLAQERCGLKQMRAWQQGGKKADANWQDLPLFQEG